MTIRARATIALSLATLIWGSTFVLVDSVVATIPVHSFLSLRFTIAFLALLMIRPRALRGVDRTTWRRGLLLGATLGVGYATQTQGLALGTVPTVSGFITGLFVVLTPLLSAWWFKTRVGWSTAIAVALATAGLALLTLNGGRVGGGEWITTLCAIAFAAQIVLLGRWSTPGNTLALVLIQLGTVAVAELLFALVVDQPLALPATATTWFAIVFLALAATVYGFWAQTWAQAHMSATRAAVIMTTEPMFAALTGAIAGDRLRLTQAGGAALVLAAMYLVELSPARMGGRESAEARIPHLEP